MSSHGGGRGRPSSSDTGEAAGQDMLAVRMGELARSLQQEGSLQDTLQGIVTAAVDTVPGAQFAGISEVQGRLEINTPALTDELVRASDAAQYETGQGPCLDAIYVEQTVRVSDMASEDRWPEFAKRAAQLGVRSMLSFQLYVVGDNLGALNLYNREPDAFDDESEHVGLLFASHAAVAMAGAQRNEQLNRAELEGINADGPGLGVSPVGDFYRFAGHSDVVNPVAAVAARVDATEKALAAGYTGFRAVVDATAVVRSAEQREAFACFEHLLDREMCVRPVSTLCAYDVGELGSTAVAELACLHPLANPGSAPFQLHAERDVDFALAGDIDLACDELFATTVRRVVPLSNWSSKAGQWSSSTTGGCSC